MKKMQIFCQKRVSYVHFLGFFFSEARHALSRRCRSYWHVHPNASLARVVGHYDVGPDMIHCGPYKVCAKHPGTMGRCRACGDNHTTGRTWNCDNTVLEYEVRCSANSWPYRYTTNS